jgi:chaperonin cofactor prefoldin
MNNYINSRQLESDLEIIERQLHRLTQEVRMVNSELAQLVEAIKAARGSQKR